MKTNRFCSSAPLMLAKTNPPACALPSTKFGEFGEFGGKFGGKFSAATDSKSMKIAGYRSARGCIVKSARQFRVQKSLHCINRRWFIRAEISSPPPLRTFLDRKNFRSCKSEKITSQNFSESDSLRSSACAQCACRAYCAGDQTM